MARRSATGDRLERLDILARMLRDRPGITADEIARVLGVSARSVFRDIGHLRERGYPIEGGRGRGGGLRIHASWGLGRVLLSSEEALCTLLSLAVAERLGFPMFASEAGRARRKIVDAFPTAERRRIAPLRERVFVGEPASARVRASYGDPVAAAVRSLQAAFVAERIVGAEYVSEDGTISMRLIEPHALVINWPAWYLLGFDLERQGARTFRFDRFRSVFVDTRTFRASPRSVGAELLADPRIRIDTL